MNPARELTQLLEKTGRTREWLVKQTGNTAVTVKQYLNGTKSSRPFFEKAKKILLEELSNQSQKAKPPLQWDLLFATEEEFTLVDRASRMAGAESMTEFCRAVLIKTAREIIEAKKRGRYPVGSVRSLKVADKPKKDGE